MALSAPMLRPPLTAADFLSFGDNGCDARTHERLFCKGSVLSIRTMPSKLQVYCEALMESCWLAAAITLPLFFNISSVRMFEPDKMFVFKFLSVIAGSAWLLKWIDARGAKSDSAGKSAPLKPSLGFPLFIPVLALAIGWTISSILSILPAESWLGSYTRAQGTISFYCCVIIFLVLISELKIPDQLRRLQYALILTSIPTAAYSILQFLGVDPIPWTGVHYERSSGSMGNPIFLGAYMVMIIPLTFSRFTDGIGILRKKGDRGSGFVLASCSGVALILQMAALLCTQSRGPVFGLAAAGYLCLFIFLVMKRTAGKVRFLFPAAAAGLGSVAAVTVVVIALMVSDFPARTSAACLGATVVFIVAVYLFIWRTPFGRTWLWLAWLAQTVVLALIFAWAVTGHRSESGRLFPAFGRLMEFSDNSVRARKSIWQTGLEAMKSGSPATLPDGAQDMFHALRSAVGYGPECIWFPVNLHADPDLVEIHSGNADRMHNELFDRLISTGIIGGALYLFVFGAALFYSLQYLGLIADARQKTLFAVFIGSGGGGGAILPWLAGMPQMLGVGIQSGILAGLLGYVAWRGFRGSTANPVAPQGHVFVLCILGALIAHFAETAVGISVAPTRAYYFMLLAVLSVLVAGNIKQDTHEKKGAAKPLPWMKSPLPAITAVAALVVLVEAWCFIVNTTAERSAPALFLETWFAHSNGQRAGIPLPGNLILLVLTIGAGIALMHVEKSNVRLQRRDSRKGVRFFLCATVFVWLAVGFLAAFFWAALDPSKVSPIDNSVHAEARITLLLLALLMLLFATAFALVSAESGRYAAAASLRIRSLATGFLLAAVATVVVAYLTVRPAWADIACHIARVYERAGDSGTAVRLFERAISLEPHVVPYRISLGFVQGRSAASDPFRLREAEQSFQSALELNPLDPASNRTLGGLYMQAGEWATDSDAKRDWLVKAIPYFDRAIRLAPNNPEAYNGLGRCHFLLGNYEKAGGLYRRSLKMYPEYAQTYMYMGELYYKQNNLDGALQSYLDAARLEPNNIEARRNAGLVLTLLGRKQEAIREYLTVLGAAPEDYLSLRRLSSLYFSTGDYNAGLATARRAYHATPAENRPSFDAFLEGVRAEGN